MHRLVRRFLFSVANTLFFWTPMLHSQTLTVDRTSFSQCHLAGPSDPEFAKVVDGAAPGLRDTDAGRAALKDAFLLTNSSQKIVVAYQLRWTLTNADGTTTTHDLSFAEPHVLASHRSEGNTSLPPGASRLISPRFAIGEAEMAIMSSNLASLSSRPEAVDLSRSKEAAVSIDGVFFDDGTFVGPDRSDFFAKFKASTAARHDSGVSVLLGVSQGLTDSALLMRLDEQAAKRDTYTAPSAHDYYYFQRSLDAEQLAMIMRRFGRSALIANANTMKGEPKYLLKKLETIP